MPNRKLARAARKRCRKTGEPYSKARTAVLEAHQGILETVRAGRITARISRGETHDEARDSVQVIEDIAVEHGTSYEAAEQWYDSPGNQLMCETCGWTNNMVCPECPKGCGCETNCTGWRHRDYMAGLGSDDEPNEYEFDCDDCGGSYNSRTGYGCACS